MVIILGSCATNNNLRQKVKEARDVANKAILVMNSTKALLDTANERLAKANLETVMPKVAPTADATDGPEEALPATHPNNISQDSQLESSDSEEKQEEQEDDS
jgi:hypothetical protein